MQAQIKELQHMLNLWGAANDAKARRIAELERGAEIRHAAEDVMLARLDELQLENDKLQAKNAELRQEMTRMAGEIARLQRAIGLSSGPALQPISTAA